MERGAIISTPMTLYEDGGFSLTAEGLDRQEMRFWLLFWDKLNWPHSKAVSFRDDSAEVDYLQQAGVLERIEVELVGGEYNTIFFELFDKAFEKLEADEPGIWSIAQGENSLNLPRSLTHEHRGLQVQLYRALPVPDIDVPLEDILSFKLKRHAELEALRAALDELYQTIIQSPDKSHALLVATDRIKDALDGIHRVISENRMPRRLMTFNANLNVSKAALGFAAGTLLGENFCQMPLELGVAGALLSIVDISIDLNPRRQLLANEFRPYVYQARYEKELFNR